MSLNKWIHQDSMEEESCHKMQCTRCNRNLEKITHKFDGKHVCDTRYDELLRSNQTKTEYEKNISHRRRGGVISKMRQRMFNKIR